MKAGVNEPGILSVRVGEAQRTRLAERVGQPIVFGIRPENITAQTARSLVAGQDLRAVVEVVEPMGSETYLYLTTGAHSFVARVHANERFTVNENLSLTFDMTTAHFFDPVSEVRIAE
jgi:multiple sugar transport system ATP-binding protein